nr:RecName: Full=Dermonecrotic toxin LgSicTox-beta-LOXN8; AltName: Full=Phospholipase D; Short=PLD; AltName: Full=Sphingomyelin phosphodiesterase D; Short=SMD; Short=SMase D; Short=Sphingomyelinase D [Loxosceles gaucho]
ADSRKPIWI